MKKQNLGEEWKKVTSEILENKPSLKGVYPDAIIENRELLLLGQVELEGIESENNISFHSEIYKIIMKYYFKQKKCLKI